MVGVTGRSLGKSGQADQLPVRHTDDSGKHLVAAEGAAPVDVQVSWFVGCQFVSVVATSSVMEIPDLNDRSRFDSA